MHPVVKSNQLADTLRNQVCEIELVSRLLLDDGSTQDVTNVRRAVCKKAVRRKGKTVLTFADIDRSALERVFPFETFTVADFPEIFVDHVGRRIAQGVGTARKVPLTWITNTGGTWKYAGPKVIGTPGTVLEVYRGYEHGKGAIVDPSEYTVGTAVGAVTGVTVLTVEFTQEQRDDNGRDYTIDADIDLPGSRLPSDEVKRILEAYVVNPDAATFAAAAAYDTGAGFAVDTLYGGTENGRTGNAILQDLLNVARGWLSPTAAGAWALVQDIPKASVESFDSQADQIEIDDYGDGDIEKTITLDYRPRSSVGQDYTGHLSRTTTGAAGELRMANPYVYEHGVADRLVCYWQKRKNSLKRASGSIHAVQLPSGERITITDDVTLGGTKDFIMAGVRRPADRNQVSLREYDEDIYVYTAESLPADATNGYSPDYSYTPPAAPASVTVVDGGASVAADGTMTSFARIRATPPAANWATLMAQITNDTTGEIYQAQLRLVSGNYEARITGLRPNVVHSVIAWAVNANNVEGVTAAPVPATFTSATFSTSPSTPTSLQKVSGGTTADANGVVRAYALIRAVPPVSYSRKLMAQVKDTTTGAIQQAQLLLNAGNYEARFDGLLCNRGHEVIAWAVNFDNQDGGVTAPVGFTSDNYSTAPGAPGTCAAEQRSPRQIRASWANVNPVAGAPAISYYLLERKVGAGAYAERARVKTTEFVDDSVDIGTTYQYRVSAVDALGNPSNVTASGSVAMVAIIGDSLITSQGVSGTSIANSSINRSRTATSTGSTSGSIGAGVIVQHTFDTYTFASAPYANAAFTYLTLYAPSGGSSESYAIAFYNHNGFSVNYSIDWRKTNA